MVIRLSLSYLGDGGGVIKPIAGDDEEIVGEKRSPGIRGRKSVGLVYQRDDWSGT